MPRSSPIGDQFAAEHAARIAAHAARVGKVIEAEKSDAELAKKKDRRRERCRMASLRWWRKRHGKRVGQGRYPRKYRAVRSDDGTVYPNALHAAMVVGRSEHRIYRALSDPRVVVGGLRWCWADQPDPECWKEPRRRERNNRAVKSNRGGPWPSVLAASKALGCSTRYLTEAIQNQWLCRGRKVYYAEAA